MPKKISGTGGKDTLSGSRGKDAILALDDDDIVDASSGNDFLSGGAGNDVLIGGAGADLIDGGAGFDRIVYEGVTDSSHRKIDTILGFESGESFATGDKIDITALGGAGADLEWTGTTATAFAAWYAPVDNGVLLLVDTTGDAVADLEVAVQGVSFLQRNDILGITNHAPEITAPDEETSYEDTPLVFSTENSNVISVADPENQTLTVTLSTWVSDALTLGGINGLDFAAGDGTADSAMTFSGTAADINAALDGLTHAATDPTFPAPILTITVDDGEFSDIDFVLIGFLPVNDAPSGFDITINANEDTLYTLSPEHFGLDDSGEGSIFLWNSLARVKITTLPLAGSLTLNGVAVADGQVISRADLNAGNLEYLAAPDANGLSYASLTFQVQDSGGTASGGVDLDPTPDTMTINVNSVNDAPAGADNTVVTGESTPYVFAAADFGFTDPHDSPANGFLAVKITSLPTDGTLARMDGEALDVDDFVLVSSINAGLLTFAPEANANGPGYADFMFQVLDNGGAGAPFTSISGGGGSIDGGPSIIFPPTHENPPSQGGLVGNTFNLDQTPNTMTIDVTPTVDFFA